MDAKEVITSLCSKDEGLAVLFETVATLYQHDTNVEQTDGEAPSEGWMAIGYGLPSIIAYESELTLCITDFDEEWPCHEVTISSSEQFILHDDQFIIIGEHNTTAYGIFFSDAAVAKKISKLINQILVNDQASHARKRFKLSDYALGDEPSDSDWMVVDREEGVDDVDGPLFRRHTLRRRSKSRSRSNSPLTISDPADFRHVSHVGQDSSVGQLTKSMTASISASISPLADSDTVSTSSSFAEMPTTAPVPVAPPPPTAPPLPAVNTTAKPGAKPLPGMSLQDELLKGVTLKSSQASGEKSVAGSIADELKRGVTLKPVGTVRRQLPKPPVAANHGQLLFEINTFKRNTLRRVETTSRNMTDSQSDPNDLEALLKCSLEKMRGKLNMRNFSRVGTVNSNGEESGFEDEYDGPLLV